MGRFWLASSLAVWIAGAAAAQPPPASAFGRAPNVVEAAISPDGRTIAILGGSAAERTLSFAGVDQPGRNVLKLGDNETVDIQWAGDSHVLLRVAVWRMVPGRTGYRFIRNLAVTPNAEVASYLMKNDDASSYLLGQPVLGVVQGPPARVLVRGLYTDRGTPQQGRVGELAAALWSVDPATGEGVLLERGDVDTSGWEVDLDGHARTMTELDDRSAKYRLLARAKGNANWTLIQGSRDDSSQVYFGYSDPDDAIYMESQEADGTQMLRRSLKDGAVTPFGRKVSGADPSLVWDPHRATAVGVSVQRERTVVEWLDPDIARVHATLSRLFPDREVTLASWSRDRTRFVVRTDAPDAPPSWSLYDRTRKELSPIDDAYPELAGAALGRTTWITYKARDGLEIPAYLTLPPQAGPAGGPPPLVILAHDGSRDTYGFHAMAQFLATRGYAVLRPQFRGSAGFGLAYRKAAEGEWGGKMQTDLLDGVAALAGAGTIDPTRVCVVGSYFGGYLAQAAAVFQPEAYRCAASIGGVSDLGMSLRQFGDRYGTASPSYRMLRRKFGVASDAGIDAISPLKQAARAGAPILLMHSERDMVVPPEQSRLMAEALAKAGKPYEHLVLKGEGATPQRSDNRTLMLETLERFLAKYLPVDRS